ncbi:ThiF family adenylyltransferase [Dyella acidisoli]|uniref:ThiF family adenylyltransferase n=1 Tax=Dyella acidisoli TaxID=1867834 RepID=UPI0024E0B0CD|nr:ThiF family adenylyltransferase [Dyella acidisoli]
MPDATPGERRSVHVDARATLAAFLQPDPIRAHELSAAELHRRYPARHFVAGWRFTLPIATTALELDVLVGDEFPWQAPRVALAGASRFLQWPHVERDGVLCLVATHVTVDASKPVAVLKELLGRAVNLLEASLAGTNVDDFRSEFMSYWEWSWRSEELHRTVYTLSTPESPSRFLVAWRGNQCHVVADDESTLRRWLSHRHDETVAQQSLSEGVLLWLPQPLLPAEYPKTGMDMLHLLHEHAPALKEKFLSTMAQTPSQLPIVMASPTTAGPGQIAVTLIKPSSTRLPAGVRRDPLTSGFRAGHVPTDVLAQRYLGMVSIERGVAVRLDADWVHGRGRDPRAQRLRDARVVVLGCGSVGAPVAMKLASAGVGHLAVVDPESLSAANVGRHPLGISDCGLGKANALAQRLRAAYPHMIEVTAHSSSWQVVASTTPHVLQQADLIVSAIGDWADESALNAWQIANGRRIPILYGWTEAYAAAGHSVLIGSVGGCLACGFTGLGVPSLAVAQSNGAIDLQQEPACGTTFQMYGPVELTHVEALIAEHALDTLLGINDGGLNHRIWVGRRRGLIDPNVEWTPEWLAFTNWPPHEGRIYERAWPCRATCTCRSQDGDHLCNR